MCMTKPATKKKKTAVASPKTRGAFTEQIVFRVSKATRLRLESKRRQLALDNLADVLRLTLREAGL